MSDEHHVQLRLPGNKLASYNDVALAALDHARKDTDFIFAGDWNTARLTDTNFDEGPAEGATDTEFLRRAAARGWKDSMRGRYARTFLSSRSAPYQNDHVFTDAATHARLKSLEVFYTIDGSDTGELSDHAPVLADFDLETSG